MFCPNCGTQLAAGVNFCPNCGTQVNNIAKPADQENRVMLVSLGDCARPTAAALLQQICGYTSEEALLIVDNAPITVARGLNDSQARYLAQAFAEFGMEVSVYDGNGWRDWESTATSVWDQAGGLLAGVAAALGLINLNNRISRDMMHRMDFPYRYTGTRPPVYRLNSTLRAAPPRRVVPAAVRPPVHHAPTPAPRPAPPPVRPAPVQRPVPPPAPASRPVPPSVKPAPVQRPAPAPHPVQGGPVSRPVPGGRPGNGRPGGGSGRRG